MATAKAAPVKKVKQKRAAKTAGRFGPFGGQYVPETLMAAIEELAGAYDEARRDRKFKARLDGLMRQYAGRPTPLYFARRLTEQLGGARIYLKREDLLHTCLLYTSPSPRD